MSEVIPPLPQYAFVGSAQLKKAQRQFYLILPCLKVLMTRKMIRKKICIINMGSDVISQLFHVEVFWVVTPCCYVVGCQRFRGSCCLHLQGEVAGMGENGIDKGPDWRGAATSA
jgi:hypothetical protein